MADKILDQMEALKGAIQANPEMAERLGPQLRELIDVARIELERIGGLGGPAGYCHSHCGSHCISHPSERLGNMLSRYTRRL